MINYPVSQSQNTHSVCLCVYQLLIIDCLMGWSSVSGIFVAHLNFRHIYLKDMHGHFTISQLVLTLCVFSLLLPFFFKLTENGKWNGQYTFCCSLILFLFSRPGGQCAIQIGSVCFQHQQQCAIQNWTVLIVLHFSQLYCTPSSIMLVPQQDSAGLSNQPELCPR